MTQRIKDLVRNTQMPDEDWEAIKQDVPALEEPFLKQYVAGREKLIRQEKSQRSDAAFRDSLSPLAREACYIVDRIRDDEQRTIWTSEFEDHLAQETGKNVYPGMMFNLAKERMEKTKLWKIVRRMPKGALLHSHFDAMVDMGWVIETLLATPGMHLYCKTDISTLEKLEVAPFKFRFLKKDTVTEHSIWTSSYKSMSPTAVTVAAENFPNGGRAGFVAWLKDRFTITQSESIDHHHGLDAVWRKFTSVFMVLDSIIRYEPIFRAFIQRMFTQLHEDGVNWIDLRATMVTHFYLEGSEVPEATNEAWFKCFGEEIEKFKNSEAGKGFWGARLIWTGIRILDTRSIIEDMDACITMKLAYPHLIAGYDLVGQEDPGRPLKDLLPELFWFRKQCAQEGVEIPFFFHAGETLGDGSETDENLFDAILLGTRRIGHGFSLYKHPLLIDMVKEKKIMVESCPISNEVLRLCASVMSHPLPALLARGVACSLCNDDPGILGQDTAGMTHDFWQALQGWDNLGLAGLGSLAENSVRWAAFEDQNSADWVKGVKEASLGEGIRAQRMQEWSIEWEKFCLWVVSEFGEDKHGLEKILEETKLSALD